MAGSETKWVDHWQKRRDETLHENEIPARGNGNEPELFFTELFPELVNFTEYSFFPWEKSVMTLLLLRPFFITWVFLRIRGVLQKKTPRIPKKLTL